MAVAPESATRTERFARVFVEDREHLPFNVETYHDPDRGYFFKLRLENVTADEAAPLIKSAKDRFDVEIVRRAQSGGFYKERVYVQDASEVPEGFKVRQGPKGGVYYETGVQSIAQPDASSRNVAVITWSDTELGDEIVFETPGGEEVFAEIVHIEEGGEDDRIYVDVDGVTYEAAPGTYSVDKSATVAKDVGDPWQPYQGPRGGEGWINVHDGRVVYGDKPEVGDAEGSDGDVDSGEPDFDPAEPPSDGHAEGWTGPPESEADLGPGQKIEFWEGNYFYGTVEEVGDGEVTITVDETGEKRTIDVGEVTSREEDFDPAPETAPDPDEDIPRFHDDEFAGELIENVSTDHEEGFTFKRNLEPEDVFDTDVYYVAITGETFDFEGGITKDDIVDFYEGWLDLLEDEPGLRIGGWSFPEDHEKGIAVDLSMAVADRDEAVEMGERLNQQSVGNLVRDDFVETGGTGESVVDSPEGVREILDDVESLAKTATLGKAVGTIDPEAVYVGVESGEQLRGRQIGYIGLRGSRQIEIEDGVIYLDGERFEGTASKSEGSDGSATHSARYSPEDEEDDAPDIHVFGGETEKFDPLINGHDGGPLDGEIHCEEHGATFEESEAGENWECPWCGESVIPESLQKADEGIWTYYYGPKGGEGWINVMTGEKRYQKRRPGDAPEDGDGYDDWLEDGWSEPPDDLDELEFGQTVEIQDHTGEFQEGQYAGVNEQGYHTVEMEDEAVRTVGEEMANTITAAEEGYELFAFGDSHWGDAEHYWSNVSQDPEVRPDWATEMGIGVGTEFTVETADFGDVTLPVYGYWDGDASEDGSDEDDIVVHWEDLPEGMKEMMGYDDPPFTSQTPTISAGDKDKIVAVDGEPVGEGGEPEEPLYDAFWPEVDESVAVTPETTTDGYDGYRVQAGVYDGAWISEDDLEDIQPANQAAEEDEPADAEPDGDEEVGESPSEDEASEAVAQPTSSSPSGEDFDFATEYDPEMVEEWGSLGEFGFPEGVSSMEVGRLSHYEGSDDPAQNEGLVFRTKYGPGETDPGLGNRQMVTHDIGKAIGARMPTHVGHPEEGYVDAEGVDGRMAQDWSGGFDEIGEDFWEQAGLQILLGNNDAHAHNVLVGNDEKIHMIDIDHSAGYVGSEFVGQKTWYASNLDRALGELTKTAQSLGSSLDEAAVRKAIYDSAIEQAQELVDEDGSVLPEIEEVINQSADAYDSDMAQNVRRNIEEMAAGEIGMIGESKS